MVDNVIRIIIVTEPNTFWTLTQHDDFLFTICLIFNDAKHKKSDTEDSPEILRSKEPKAPASPLPPAENSEQLLASESANLPDQS